MEKKRKNINLSFDEGKGKDNGRGGGTCLLFGKKSPLFLQSCGSKDLLPGEKKKTKTRKEKRWVFIRGRELAWEEEVFFGLQKRGKTRN